MSVARRELTCALNIYREIDEISKHEIRLLKMNA